MHKLQGVVYVLTNKYKVIRASTPLELEKGLNELSIDMRILDVEFLSIGAVVWCVVEYEPDGDIE